MERFEVASQAIRTAGEALRRCHLEAEEIRQKADHQDLVTYWDRRTERLLRREILAAFPQDSIVGEEYPPEEHGAEEVTWYLDPIDGTGTTPSRWGAGAGRPPCSAWCWM